MKETASAMATTTTPARFHYRLGANQPAASPTARRLAEMAEAIGRETDGAFRLDVFPESRLGPDQQMFADALLSEDARPSDKLRAAAERHGYTRRRA